MATIRKPSTQRAHSTKLDARFMLDVGDLAIFFDHGLAYFIDPKHPLAGPQTGWVSLLRHLASVERKRWLEPHEIVTAGPDGKPVVITRAQAAQSLPPRQRVFDPSTAELTDMVWKMPLTKVAAHYGVSDVAVKKRCKALGVETPPRGHWLRARASADSA